MNKMIILGLLVQSSLIARAYVYLDAEAMYLQRGGSSHKVLAEENVASTYTDVLTSKNMVHTLSYEPALRISVGASNEHRGGMFRALVSRGWSGHKQVSSVLANLQFPFENTSYAPGYQSATQVKATYKNNLTLIEGYFTRDFTPLWDRYFAFRGFLGLQYFNIPDKTDLSFYTPILGPVSSIQKNTYTASVTNDLGLAAVGLMIQIKPSNTLAMELIGYAGVGGSFINSKTDLKILGDTVSLRKSHTYAAGMAYSFLSSVRATYRPVEWFEMGLGYEFFYATGVSMSYKQMSSGVRANSSSPIHHNANMWVQGASLRIGFRL